MPRSIVTGTFKTTKPILAATPGGGTRLKTGALKNSGLSKPTTSSVTPSAVESGQPEPPAFGFVKSAFEQGGIAVGLATRPSGGSITRSLTESSGTSPSSGSSWVLASKAVLAAKGCLAGFDRRAAVFVFEREAEVFEAEGGVCGGGEAKRQGQCRSEQCSHSHRPPHRPALLPALARLCFFAALLGTQRGLPARRTCACPSGSGPVRISQWDRPARRRRRCRE